MKFKSTLLLLLTFAIGIGTTPRNTDAKGQNSRLYQQMNQTERAAFVSEQARRLALQISGRNYQFTPAFEAAIQHSVDSYVQRIGNNRGEAPDQRDARVIFERGQTYAPILSSTFKARNVSELIGLYLPAIESEYVNLQSPNPAGAIGMFQFLPKTGELYGLTPNDLLDVQKSADAAARYIADGIKKFNDDPMKEALALLAYNRGFNNVQRDIASLVTPQTRACSICALTEQSYKLDATFRTENVYYVPRFFAAAIIGENPQAFGLQTQPLSAFSVPRNALGNARAASVLVAVLLSVSGSPLVFCGENGRKDSTSEGLRSTEIQKNETAHYRSCVTRPRNLVHSKPPSV